MKKLIIIVVTFLVFSIVNCRKDRLQVEPPLTKEECEKIETKQWNAEANEGKGACEAKVETSSEASYIDECNKIHDELGACYERTFSSVVAAEMEKCDDDHDKSEKELFKRFLKVEQLFDFLRSRSKFSCVPNAKRVKEVSLSLYA